MKLVVIPASIAEAALIASQTQATIPTLNATRPSNIEFDAGADGQIYINGKEGKLKAVKNNDCEARGDGITISLSINPDGSDDMSSAGPKRANGVCQVKDDNMGADPAGGACPPDVSEADR